MLSFGNTNRRSKALSRRVVQKYTRKTKQGQLIEIFDDGNSKFDRVIGKLGDIKEGGRVCLANDKSCTGTVQWIGRYHVDHGTEVDEQYHIIGVKLDSTRGAYQHQCSHGGLDDEYIVPSTTKDILFKYFPEWIPIKEQPSVFGGSAGGAAGAKKSKHFAEKADDTCNGLVHQSPQSKFDRMDLDVNGLHVGSRVKRDTGSVGTVRWIGCYHKKVVKLSDYIVGVELDSTARESMPLLTNGLYEGERLVESTKNNIKFTKLKNLSPETSAAAKEFWSTVQTCDGIPIEIYDHGKSAFDKVCSGIAGIQEGDKVYLYSDKTRTGTVKWIGCDHGQASNIDPKDFLVGVEVDKPEKEQRGVLTDGAYCKERLVFSQKRNVIFAQLNYCTLLAPSMKPKMVNDTKPQLTEMWYTVCTSEGIPIEIYHGGKSAFDRVRYGIAGIQYDDKVYLYSEKTRTGTVKWIGCNHGEASNKDPKDFLVGVEMDRPEREVCGILTDGSYCREQLVLSQKKNVMFAKLQYCNFLKDSDTKPGMLNDTNSQLQDKRWSTVNTLDGIPVEIYDDGKSTFDRVRYGIAGIQYNDRVQLYSDKDRAGTVKWIGCDHGKASEIDPKEFFVGIEMDKPEKEKASVLTDGNYYGEQLVTSSLKNVRFTKLKYWTLGDPISKPLTTDTKSQPSGTLKREKIWNGYLIELYHDGKSAFDKACSGVAGICDDDKVQLYADKGITGTVKWIGCYHGTASETDHSDFLVGVQVDKPEDEYPSHPTDGTFYCERLVISQNKNIVFTSLKYWILAKQTDMRPASTDVTQHHNDVPKSRQPSKKTNPSPIQHTPLTGHTKQTTHGKGTVCSPGAAVQSVPQQPIPAKALEKKVGADVYIENDHQRLVGMKEKVETEIGKLCSENVVASRNIRGDISHLPFSDSSEPSRVLSSNQVVRALEDESGAFDDFVNEYVLPPMHCEEYRGYWRGVQGDVNSSYMDASLFAMFSYLTVFDSILFKGNAPSGHSTDEHIKRTDDIRSVLRTQIVNPLRKYGLAHQQGIRRLRRLLDEGCLSAVEKDPEEFLNHLLVEMFCTPYPIVLSDGQESHLFHLLEKKAEGMDFPTIQELVERTCLQQNVKFQKIPPYLILRLPTFGKDRKVYEKILPSLELDITDMLTESTQSCYVCGYAATHQCCGCYDISHKISESTFCSDCTEDYHKSPHRREHKPQKLVVADKGDGLSSPKCVLKLAVAICTKASHYVSFVATDTTADAKWYFFDNMADRDGATDVPQVTEIMGFRKHLRDAKSANNLPLPVRRLIKDGHMCLYVNPEVPQFKPTNAPLKIITPNGTSKV